MLTAKQQESVNLLKDLKAELEEVGKLHYKLCQEKVELLRKWAAVNKELRQAEHKLSHEVLPAAKNAYFESLKDQVFLKTRIAKSEIDEAVLAVDEVAEALKRKDILENDSKEIWSQLQIVDTQIDAVRSRDFRLQSIAKFENLLLKIQFGLTKIDVGDYLNDDRD